MRANVRRSTWGSSRLQLGKFIQYMSEVFIHVMLQSSVTTGVVHSHQKVCYMDVQAKRNHCQEYISQLDESDTTQLEKMMSEMVIEWNIVKGLCGT